MRFELDLSHVRKVLSFIWLMMNECSISLYSCHQAGLLFNKSVTSVDWEAIRDTFHYSRFDFTSLLLCLLEYLPNQTCIWARKALTCASLSPTKVYSNAHLSSSGTPWAHRPRAMRQRGSGHRKGFLEWSTWALRSRSLPSSMRGDTGINKMKPALVKHFSNNVPAWRWYDIRRWDSVVPCS